jgi:hypothetical protein
VLEIVLSVLAGEGSLDIDLGGAYATTDGTAYVNPLDGSAGSGPSDSTSPSQDDSGLGGGTNLSPLLAAAGDTTTTSQPGSPSSGASGRPTKLALQRVGSSCASTSVGGCHTPRSAVILITLAALTLGLISLESLRMRRRKRLLIPEDT